MNLENKKKIIITTIAMVILIIAFVIYWINSNTSYQELNWQEEVLEQNSQENAAGENSSVENTNGEIEEKEMIVVHITGEVKKEGVLYLEKGARIVNAIEEAGGATKEADLSQVNLAYELQDGQKIYIPNKNEQISTYITENSGDNTVLESEGQKMGKSQKVNINTANQTELDYLPGIGPALAQRIIEYRKENGKFKNIDELKNVKGIGDSKYEEIKDSITV